MDVLKSISFSIALFIIGAIFLLLGLSGGITISGNSLIMQESWAKILSSVIGGLLVIISIWIEVKPKLSGKSGKETAIKNGEKARADNFFYTLDDKSAESFPSMVEGAIRVQILGRTAVNLLGQYEKLFEQLGKSGCEIQLLFVDPLCETAKFIYGSNPEVYKNNIISASQHLNRMKGLIGHRLQVKVTKHAPTMSIIAIEKQDMQKGFLQVQLYFLHSAVGRDRPIFRINRDDRWYGVFRDEFTQLWSDSVEWNISQFLEQTNKQ